MPSRLAGTAGGAASGAAIGSSFGPWGTAGGALIGGALGYFGSGGGSSDAANAQHQGVDAAMQRLQQLSEDQYQGRMQDLNKTLAFYGPAQRYLQSIYSAPPPGAVAPPAPRPMGGAPQVPPGFPKDAPASPMAYGQGPRRGF